MGSGLSQCAENSVKLLNRGHPTDVHQQMCDWGCRQSQLLVFALVIFSLLHNWFFFLAGSLSDLEVGKHHRTSRNSWRDFINISRHMIIHKCYFASSLFTRDLWSGKRFSWHCCASRFVQGLSFWSIIFQIFCSTCIDDFVCCRGTLLLSASPLCSRLFCRTHRVSWSWTAIGFDACDFDAEIFLFACVAAVLLATEAVPHRLGGYLVLWFRGAKSLEFLTYLNLWELWSCVKKSNIFDPNVRSCQSLSIWYAWHWQNLGLRRWLVATSGNTKCFGSECCKQQIGMDWGAAFHFDIQFVLGLQCTSEIRIFASYSMKLLCIWKSGWHRFICPITASQNCIKLSNSVPWRGSDLNNFVILFYMYTVYTKVAFLLHHEVYQMVLVCMQACQMRSFYKEYMICDKVRSTDRCTYILYIYIYQDLKTITLTYVCI